MSAPNNQPPPSPLEDGQITPLSPPILTEDPPPTDPPGDELTLEEQNQELKRQMEDMRAQMFQQRQIQLQQDFDRSMNLSPIKPYIAHMNEQTPVPTFDSKDTSSYDAYLRQVYNWTRMTMIPVKHQAYRLISGLSGRAAEIACSIEDDLESDETVNGEDHGLRGTQLAAGVVTVIKVLNETYRIDAAKQAASSLQTVVRMRRKPGQTVNDFAQDFVLKVRIAQRKGAIETTSDSTQQILCEILLTGIGLDAQQRGVAITRTSQLYGEKPDTTR